MTHRQPPRLILPITTTPSKKIHRRPYSMHTFAMSVETLSLAPFEDAMNKALDKMTQKERDELSVLQTIDDVYAATDKIQKEQGQKGVLRNSNKIKPYLLWLQQFSGVIEVFVSIKPGLLALIWVSICSISPFHGFSGTNY